MATKVKPSRLQVTWTPQAWQVPVYVDEDCFQWWDKWEVSDAAYSCDWDWDTTHSPSKNAMYDKISAMDIEIAWKANSCDLATVATSWEYCDLSGTPTIPTDNCELANGCWYAVASSLCTVATSWKYCDLTGTPTIWSWTLTIQKNWTCVDTFSANATANKTINITVPTDNCQLANSCGYITSSSLSGYQLTCNMVCNLSWADNSHYPSAKAVADALQCAWAWDMLASVYDPCNKQSNAFDYCNFINTPTIPTDNCQLANWCWYTTCTGTVVASDLNAYATTASLCTVATSWKYCDLTWTPTIPAAQIQSDWTQTCNTCKDFIKNKPSLCTVATSGKYCDLTWTPSLCTVATSGKYCDLSGLPTIPTNNNQLTNGCGYTTCTGTLSTCADVISALWYTPYSSANPSGYTTCTWTLSWWDLKTVNWCCLVGSWDICIQSWVTSVNWNTWAVTVSEFTAANGGTKVFDYPSVNTDISDILSWLTSGGNVILKSSSVYKYYFRVTVHNTDGAYIVAEIFSWSTIHEAKKFFYNSSNVVTSISDVSKNFFNPSNSWTTDQVLTKTASWYQWATPSGWDVMVSSQANNILTSWMKIWAWTQANYDNLWTYDWNTVYLTIE